MGVEELEAAEVVDQDETERGQHQGCWRARVKTSLPILAMGHRRGVKRRPGVAKKPDNHGRQAGQQDDRDQELAKRAVEDVHPCEGWLSRISGVPTTRTITVCVDAAAGPWQEMSSCR